MLESNKHALARQQMVLTALGYYSGKLDGIWSAKCIQAKQEFECSGKYAPALPNRGLPFDLSKPLPTGLFVDMTERSFNALSCAAFESDRKSLESRMKLASAPVEGDDTPVGSFGSVVLTSEEDLNAPSFKSEPASDTVPEPYAPGISKDEVPLETAMPKEAPLVDDAPSDFISPEEVSEELPLDSVNLDENSSNEQPHHHQNRNKKRKRQNRPD